MDMKVNGEVIHTGNSEAISGDPVESVVQLASLLAERGRKIEKGSIVLAGAATAAIPLESGMQIDLTVEKLPGTSIKIK
jgi:2-oxo-3-hexenedioate decarboxylase